MEMSETIGGIVTRSKVNIHQNEDDYTVDGLLYCGKCHTPKQGEYEMPWGVVKPYILCRCEVEKRKAEEDAEKERMFRERVVRMRSSCFGVQTEKMKTWTFANDKRDNLYITNAAEKYVENFKEMRERGKGLLLFGEVGRGKSFVAACIANALIDKGYQCYMTNFSSLTNKILATFEKQEFIDSLSKYALLIIDDLAAERKNSSFMDENIHNVIDSRIRSGLPMIITTNLTREELQSPADMEKQRIFSRLLENCIPIEVKGKDRRKEHLRDTMGEYKEMLGI